jgi:NAD(P)-dependent dehydrogenase (short-subunit alcohol dehydrogenase family)
MTNTLAGKVAVVTGAGRGIGLAIARRYAAEGAKVVLSDIVSETVEQAAADLRDEGYEALAVVADAGLAADVDALFATTVSTYGTVDILVNNAALTSDQRHFFNGDEEWWDKFLRINLKSQYLCTDRAARIMAHHGGGSIINMSSGGGTRAHRGMSAYDAAKGGTEALTRTSAVELGPYGIRVNTLVPGLIATFAGESEESLQQRHDTVPMGRGGVPEDLAGPAVFLASDDAAYVTGSALVVDGGLLVQQRSPQVDTLQPKDYPTLDQVALAHPAHGA